jgi:hypothetical protein
MVMYYINAEPGRNRVVGYIDLDISLLRGISSEPKYEMNVFFNLTGSVDVMRSSNGGHEVIGTSHDLALLNVTCELTFETNGSIQQQIMQLRPTQDARLYLNGNTVFCAQINPNDAEHLNTWRKGNTVLIRWRIFGHVAIIDSDRLKQFPVFWLDVSNHNDNRNALPSLDTNAFTSKIINPLKLSNTFIEEFPIEIPETIRKATGLPPGISGLRNDLYSLIEHLSSAVEVLRNAKTGYDYRHVMDEVKSALDSLRNYKNKSDLGKELLVETSIIGNIDPSGGDFAAAEVIVNFSNILDNTYWIASKPAHTKLQKKPQKRFSMDPDRADALLVLTIALASSKYLLQRIEHYITTVL